MGPHLSQKLLLELSITRTNKNIWPKGWREKTCVMGVINITPDSFSDGGQYFDAFKAEERALDLINQGADVIDLGAQSTRPMAKEVASDEEIKRLIPALKLIRNSNPDVLISVDTFNSKVAYEALSLGADWINDVSGGRHDPFLLKLVAQANCPYVLMHSRGNSCSMDKLTNYKDVTFDVHQGLLKRTDQAINAGIKKENIIWDPGLGFAKTNEQNITLLREIDVICSDEFPVLVGPSRKRFIGEILQQSNPHLRIWGTAAIACRCANAKVAMIRVHDVEAIKQTLCMAETIF